MKKLHAIVFYTMLIAACSTVDAPVKTPERAETSFMEKLAAALGKGDSDAALSLFDALPPEEARTNQNMRLKASVLVSAGRLPEARETVNTVLARDGADLDAQYILSKIEGASGNAKEQKRILEAVVKADGAHVGALDALGYLAINALNLKGAEGFFDRALAADATNLDALIGKASVYRKRKNPEAAVKLLTQAIDAHPLDAEPLAERGRVYRETGNPQFAIDDLQKAETLDAGNYWVVYDKARALLDMNKKREALAEFERAAHINPQNFIAYVYSAGLRDELHDYTNAILDYQALASLKPDYYFAHEMLGVYFMKDKQHIKARDAFKKAFDGAPGEYNYALLAVINAVQGGQSSVAFKPFLEQTMRKLDRSKLDYYLVRLFYDFSGDADVARRVSAEKNPRIKAQGLFYLAYYFTICGNASLAATYIDEFGRLDRKDLIEWRIYDWVVQDGALSGGSSATALKN
ncbi:MAG: tetratricopeptide repeat protein [Spirochaetaceae bacterium]|jgi:tetratricopeptide (TPR) repeat protein|nr:tetratricopeptide repeat protein [Spirochaetaceae bacterium]